MQCGTEVAKPLVLSGRKHCLLPSPGGQPWGILFNAFHQLKELPLYFLVLFCASLNRRNRLLHFSQCCLCLVCGDDYTVYIAAAAVSISLITYIR